jgi:predicted nucleic acid-binding protein
VIVVDASAVLDLLLGIPPHDATVAGLVAAEAPNVFAPHLLDAEVAQVMRRRVLGGTLRAADATAALNIHGQIPITRFPHLPFLTQALALRANATVYDALYLVLAESLGATLITRDAGLSSVPGSRARVRVLT